MYSWRVFLVFDGVSKLAQTPALPLLGSRKTWPIKESRGFFSQKGLNSKLQPVFIQKLRNKCSSETTITLTQSECRNYFLKLTKPNMHNNPLMEFFI